MTITKTTKNTITKPKKETISKLLNLLMPIIAAAVYTAIFYKPLFVNHDKLECILALIGLTFIVIVFHTAANTVIFLRKVKTKKAEKEAEEREAEERRLAKAREEAEARYIDFYDAQYKAYMSQSNKDFGNFIEVDYKDL